jgi:hypothetical protein
MRFARLLRLGTDPRGAWLGLGLLAAVLGCASAPTAAPEPGTGTVWGYLRLVPREGFTPSKPGASPYADRRLRDVVFVDYTKPGFAVVYRDGASPRGDAQLTIRARGVRTRLDPEQIAVGLGGTLRVENADAVAHVLSAPSIGLIRRLEPGQHAQVELAAAGELSLFLLDVARSEASVFVAPGPFAVIAQDGRFELSGLAPGPQKLFAWHPRFPPVSASLDVAPDTRVRIDLEMGVEHHDETPEGAPAGLP